MSQKDPFRLLAPCQLGKRRRDKGALLAPPGRELAACANEPEGSFDLIGTVPISPKDPFRLLAPCQLGKRRRDKGALLAPAGREFAACANEPEGSFDLIGTVPISPKDPFRLLAPCQLGKRRRDKGALLAPAGREFAACANKPEGSFDVIGTGSYSAVGIPAPDAVPTLGSSGLSSP